MKFVSIVVSVLLLCTTVGCSSGYNIDNLNDIPKPIKNTIRNAVDNGHRVGLVIGLINRNGVHYFSYGKTDISGSTKINQDNIVGVGSLYKVFTGLVFADMVDQGSLSLNDPVNKYLPQAHQITSQKAKGMTLQHLVTHTSGLPKRLSNVNSVDTLYKAVSTYNYKVPVGEKNIYSNVGMALLGHIIEKRSGKTLEQLVKTRITQPLNMGDTRHILDSTLMDKLAPGHLDSRKIATSGQDHKRMDLGYTYGGLYSSANDLSVLIKSYLNSDDSELSQVLNMTLEKLMNKNRKQPLGFAWKIHSQTGSDIYNHSGSQSGYQSFIGFNKEKGYGVVLLANSQTDDNLVNIALNLLSEGKVGLPDFSKPPEVKLPAEHLSQFIGQYKSSNPEDNAVEFSIVNGRLFYSEATAQGKMIREVYVYAKSENEFFFKEIPVELVFKADEETGVMLLESKIDIENKHDMKRTYYYERIQ